MNIALVAPGTLISKKEATFLTVLQLAKEFQRQNHKTIIIAKNHHSLPEKEVIDGITIYRQYGKKSIFLYHPQNIKATAQTLQQLNQEQHFCPDIIHGFGSSPLLAVELHQAKKFFPTSKTIYSWKSYFKYSYIQFLTPLLNKVDYITAPTNIMVKKLRIRKVKKEKISLFHSNIDCSRFKPRNREELKNKYALEGRKIILYYGALRKQKGVDYLIQALPQIIKKHPDIKVILAARSREEKAKKKYQKMAAQHNVQNNIDITLEDLPIEEYVSMADMVVLAYPSLIGTEGNPSCALETMASKTPLITTLIPELQEIITPEREALMSPPKDISALTKNILRIIENPKLVQKITENAYIKAQSFDTKTIAKKYLDFYTKITQL